MHGHPVLALLLPACAFACVAGLDAIADSRSWSVPMTALLDEPAHMLTAWLFLAALFPGRAPRLRGWALAGAVAIDLDHVPLYLWHVGTATDNGRPVTHSLLTVLVLLAAGLAGVRFRTPLIGLAVGVLLHLVRDLATGPGVPLLWPVSGSNVLLPYAGYLAALAAVAAVASVRQARRSVRSGGSRSA